MSISLSLWYRTMAGVVELAHWMAEMNHNVHSQKLSSPRDLKGKDSKFLYDGPSVERSLSMLRGALIARRKWLACAASFAAGSAVSAVYRPTSRYSRSIQPASIIFRLLFRMRRRQRSSTVVFLIRRYFTNVQACSVSMFAWDLPTSRSARVGREAVYRSHCGGGRGFCGGRFRER